MNSIDISAIAQNLAVTYPAIPTGTSTRNGGETAAETIERLIDDAAQAGAFADLIDRPSIEVSTLTHADRTIWIALEFDRDHKLLRAGPVLINELSDASLTGADATADTLTRIRQLIATAILLGTKPTPGRVPITAARRAHHGGLPLLALIGPAISDTVMEAARVVAVDAVEHPDGPTRRLGSALIDYDVNPPTTAQSIGPDPLPAETEHNLDRAEQAEGDLTELLGQPRITLNLFGASAMTSAIIHAIAAGTDSPPDAPTAVALSCAKRRGHCEDLLASVRTAQRFVIDHADSAAAEQAPDLCRRSGMINASAVQTTTMALLLSELAEAADANGEQHAAQAADAHAAGFETALARGETEAWSTAVECLHLLGGRRARETAIAAWEHLTGLVFPADHGAEP